MSGKTQILVGDVRAMLKTLPERSVHCCVTSPPYWGLRAYGTQPQVWGGDSCAHEFDSEAVAAEIGKGNWAQGTNGRGELQEGGVDVKREPIRTVREVGFCRKCSAWRGELGSEPTPELFCRNMVEVFREVWRVLRDDGTLWLNMGDSYNSGTAANRNPSANHGGNGHGKHGYWTNEQINKRVNCESLKPKDLCGIPWRLAFALQADGWYLRSDIPWVKRSPMPESVTDRPAKALEYVFLMTKSERYYFDMEAVKRAAVGVSRGASFGAQTKLPDDAKTADGGHATTNGGLIQSRKLASKEERAKYDVTRKYRNADLWFESVESPHGLCGIGDELVGLDVTSEAFSEAHFATFPRRLVEPFVKAGTSEKGCCSGCGAPWIRNTERVNHGKVDYNGKHSGTAEHSAGRNMLASVRAARLAGGTHDNPFPPTVTVGWQPSCDCNAAVVPCTVLDTFSGSGTTLLVAKSLGRNGIGCELNGEYAEMARRRIAKGYSSEPTEKPLVGQMDLFK